jgi:hypothetical protein
MEKNLDPFKRGDLYSKEGVFSDIYEIVNINNYLVKEISMSHFGKDKDYENPQEWIKDMEIVKEYLAEHIPKNQIVKGHSKNNPYSESFYILTEKVEPTKDQSTKEAESLESVLIQNLILYADTYDEEKKAGLSIDINFKNNFIYGITPSNSIPKMYLVDIFPFLNHFDPLTVYDRTYSLIRDYRDYSGYPFDKLQEKFKELNIYEHKKP